jgi:flagella basal body P-ring formation protein FlgA
MKSVNTLGATLLRCCSLLALTAVSANAGTQPTPLAGYARTVIDEFLAPQIVGLPGKTSVRIDTPISGPPPECDRLEAFLPSGARLWGRLSVGLRCKSPSPWTRYMPAYVSVTGKYYAAARPISAGQTLVDADSELREGDLTRLPDSVVQDRKQLKDAVANYSIALGSPLRKELLRTLPLVLRGQNVKLLTRGKGFTVSVEGRAMTDAALGDNVQIKIEGGRMLRGVVRDNGVVERPN